MLKSVSMSFATITHEPQVELPDVGDYDCPPDCISKIEEYHQGLHSILISKQTGRSKYKPIGKIKCQKGADRHSRPEATPDELAEYIMQWIQYEIDESDDPGNYRFTLVGPPGKGQFSKSKHIDLRDEDGIARSKDMLSEGDMLEQQSAYIGELHSQLSGMVDLVLGSYKVVVGENREMMKILSEATRKHGEIEANRLAHQLNMKIHEDEVAAQDADAERSMQKFREGIQVFKETDAAEELVRAVAKKLQGKEEQEAQDAPTPHTPPTAPTVPQPTPVPAPTVASPPEDVDAANNKATSKKKTKKGKLTKKRRSKKSSKKDEPVEAEVVDENDEDYIDPDILAQGREMVLSRPMVTAAEALKMSINEKSQWGLLRKKLNPEQLDILDEIFAATEDERVKELAQKLYNAKGLLKLANLREDLDDTQQGLISMVLAEVKR
jgi:hypothetical protein